MEYYPWLVLAHVAFVFIFVGAHGVSAFTMFRVRSETDRDRASAVLDLSTTSTMWAGIGLLLAVLLGIVAAVVAGSFSDLWPWVSIVVVAVTWILMTPLAARPLEEVRRQLGMRTRGDKKDVVPQPGSDEAFAAARAKLRPELVAGLGVVAIVVLVWLMEMKPF